MSVAAYMAAVELEQLRRTAERVRRSLHAFTQEFWQVIEPGSPFRDNWHISDICAHLEGVYHGTIKNLLINVPPGTSKSTLTSVMFPAWCWAQDAGKRFFGASYSESLSIRDAMLCRDIIQSDRYRKMFPHVAIKSDVNQKTHYGLTEGGWRLATSVGGRGTGMHPHFKIVDDPHNVKQSESDVERQNALDWFDGTLSSRGLLLNAATVVIMQRLHAKDLTGHIMQSAGYKDWDHIVIPMRYEPHLPRARTSLGFRDPRKSEGELLWPDLLPESKVQATEAVLGSYRTAGQLQQRPSPAGGGILVTAHFQLWPAAAPLPDLHFIIQSYDTAFTEDTQNDPTACTVWGIFYKKLEDGEQVRCVLLLDAWQEWLKYPALRKRLTDDWTVKYGGVKGDPVHPARRADVLLIEEKGSGISVIQELRRTGVPVHCYNPGRASKTQRAQVASAVLETDCVYLIESKKDPGQPVTWARDLVKQCEDFPNGENDDLVDTTTQALIYINHSELIHLPVVAEEEPEELDYKDRRARTNPYA